MNSSAIPKIKICGVTTLEDSLAACDAGADILGFNFAHEAMKRNRYIEPEAAQRIIEQLPPFVSTVAVTVDAPIELLQDYLQFVDYVQLSGSEPPEQCALLSRGAVPGGRVIKGFRIGPQFEVESMKSHPAAVYLLDACVPGSHGGTGELCDWPTARRAAEAGLPVMLAGGLRPDNVANAIRAVRPYAVDVAGGVESAPGKKDYAKLRAFICNAKHAWVE